jgi:phosphoadenosine phosphosulfate reductase
MTDIQTALDQERCEALATAELVAEALAVFHPRIALACSFQREEAVLLDLIFAARPDARVFALDTDVLFPETYATWLAVEQRYDTKIEVFRGPSLSAQAAVHGPRLWERDPDACCGLRKVEPLGRALADLDAWFTGLRRDQAPTRAQTPKAEFDEGRGLWKLSPLADWTIDDLDRYIAEHDLPVNPLHAQGYASIGCIHCTKPGSGREGRWSDSVKTECGLHPAGESA